MDCITLPSTKQEIRRQAKRIRQLEEALTRERAEADLLRKSLDAHLLISEETGESLVKDQVFQKVADLLLEITGFSSMGLYLYDSQARYYYRVAYRGLPLQVVVAMAAMPADRGDFLTIAAQTLQPVFTSDHASDPRAAEKVLDELGLRSIVCVPLLAGSQYLGVFSLFSTEQVFWDDAQIRWLGSIGRQIGIIIHHTQLNERLRDLAVLQERTRLGREMHDNLAQALGYLNLKASIAEGLLAEGETAKARDSLLELRAVAKETYTDVREAIFSLRTTPSPGLGLLPTLREYLAEYRAHYGLHAELAGDSDSIEFPPEVNIQLLRIVQEALTNVRKHAGASRAWVRFRREGSLVRMTVEDNGRGFDPARLGREGRQYYGLQIMRERAESIGGSLALDSRPGQGTRVVVRVAPTSCQ